MPQNQPSLPSDRSFVIQLRGDADVEHGECRGRVEHFVSAQSAHFDSVSELMAFITRIVAAQQRGGTPS